MAGLARAYRGLLHSCGVVVAVLLGAVALLVTLDVAMRNLGFGTLPWIVEVSEYSLLVATFCAAPWLLHQGGHVRVDVVIASVPSRVAAVLEIAADGIGILICLVFFYYGLAIVLDSRRIDALIIKTLVFPEWWLLAPVPLASGLLAAEFARRIYAVLAQRKG
ncbi:MAG: TRAP transporter small permease [Pseudomonadota bacterium]